MCEQCQRHYWSYNLDVHYKQVHVDIQCPEQISQKEEFLLSLLKSCDYFVFSKKL